MTGQVPAAQDLSASFRAAAGRIWAKGRGRKRQGSPLFTMRLTSEERARLEADAGETPLATYIKFRLFNNLPELTRPRGSAKRPSPETQLIAKLLAALGEARLANNLNQLAKAANTGSLPVTPETEKELVAACAEVRAMRQELMRALGHRSEERP